MGNCSLKGVAGNIRDPIRIMTDSGRIMEFEGPIQVRNVIDADFLGYGVFRKGRLSSPLFHHEQLFNGQLYYLLPLVKERRELDLELANRVNPLRLSSGKASDLVNLTTGSALKVLPSPGNGVWRVKLVIDTKQLEEILSEQVNTEALIEKMRTIASSACTTPKRTKVSWGMGRRLSLSTVHKVSPANSK